MVDVKVGVTVEDKEFATIFKKEKPDVVYHLAGAIHLRRPIDDPLFTQDLDFLHRTRIVLEACKKNQVKKIIFVSSGGAIYENAKEVPTQETYASHPTSLYGLANVVIEKYITLFCQKNKIDFALPRLSNVYGPGQWESGIIPSLILKMAKKVSPVIYGDGNQTRDFIYISDVVEVLILLAQSAPSNIYNVASGYEVSLNDILGMVKNMMASSVSATYQSSVSGGVSRSALDIKKITKELGWSPKTTMQAGLKKTIDFYVKPKK